MRTGQERLPYDWRRPLNQKRAVISLGRSLVVLAILAGCKTSGDKSPPQATAPGALLSDPTPVSLNDNQKVDVQLALGRTLARQGEQEKAMNVYRQILESHPGQPEALHRLAVLYDRQGLFEQSDSLFQQAMAARPGDAELFCDLGYSLYMQGRWPEAEMNLRQAIAIRSDHWRAHNNLGLLLCRKGELAAAAEEFRQGGCKPEEIRLNLAFGLSLEKRFAEAEQQCREALAINPSSEKAQARMQEVRRLLAKAETPAGASPGRQESSPQHTAPVYAVSRLPPLSEQYNAPAPVVTPRFEAGSMGGQETVSRVSYDR